jgi:hypothetical protein
MTRNPPENGHSIREPFGQVAVRKGFVTQVQVTEALARQKSIAEGGTAHKLIGMIMLEMGSLGTTELIDVLRELNSPVPPRPLR